MAENDIEEKVETVENESSKQAISKNNNHTLKKEYEREGKLLFAAMGCGIYLTIRLQESKIHDAEFIEKSLESSSVRKKYKKVLEIIREELRQQKIRVFDPYSYLSSAAEQLLELTKKNKQLSDADFFCWIEGLVIDFSENERHALFLASVAVCRMDGKIQEAERDVLEGLEKALKLDEDIDNLVEHIESSRKSKFINRLGFVSLIISMIGTSGWFFHQYKEFSKVTPPILGNKELIFSSVDFSRYVMMGNSVKNAYFHKAYIGHLKGTAEIYTDFKAISLQCEKRTLDEFVDNLLGKPKSPLRCKAIFETRKVSPEFRQGVGKNLTIEGVPMSVRVSKMAWMEIEEVKPKVIQIDPEKAKSFAKNLSLVVGTGAGFMLAKSTSPSHGKGFIGRWIPSFGGLSSLVVGAAGGGAVGASVYIATKNSLSFINGKSLTGNISESMKESLKKASVQTTLGELANDEALGRWYQRALSESVRRLYGRLGIEIVNPDHIEIR